MTVGDLRKIEVRYKHTRHWLWYITAISFVTGALLASCLRTQKAWQERFEPGSSWRVDVLAERLRAARDEIKDRDAEIQMVRGTLAEYEKAISEGRGEAKVVNSELQKYKVLTGLTELEGPGIVLTLNDSTLRAVTNDPDEIEGLILHDYDLQRVVNELRGAGAEAISINGQRLVERSAIRCVGPVTQVNNTPIGAPFVIRAIGDPQVLRSGLTIRGGIIDWLKNLSFQIELKELPKVRVPAYTGPVELKRARAVAPEESSKAAKGEADR